MAVFDDGSGEQLFLGGQINWAGGMPAAGLVTWRDGVFRRPTGFPAGYVLASAVYDDGATNPELYAGCFVSPYLVRSGPGGWSAATPGPNGAVHALKSFDDGTGNALFAGGSFSTIGPLAVPAVARYRNGSWSSMGATGSVRAIEVFDDGTGSALFAGGPFGSVSGVPLNMIGKWTGSEWVPLGAGIGNGPGTERVDALASFDPDGAGPTPPRLFVAGAFTLIGGGAANGFAVWNGSAWSAIPVSGSVSDLYVADLGTGPRLYAGGQFTSIGGTAASSIASYNGLSWSPLGSGLTRVIGTPTNGTVTSMGRYDDGSGPRLFVAGDFHSAGGVGSYSTAKWTGEAWESMNRGIVLFGGANSSALAVAKHDDGGGPALYVTGYFLLAGEAAAEYMAKWDGTHWSAMPGGGAPAKALASFDDGTGPALYAAGNGFQQVGGVTVQGIARWRAGGWQNASAGLSAANVERFAVHDDGTESALYVAGLLTPAGGASAPRVARRTNTGWQMVGAPFENTVAPAQAAVYEVTECNVGSGPRLYAAGRFDRCGVVSLGNVAVWDGSAWQSVGGGLTGPNSSVEALAGYDDGTGAALWATGSFTPPGGGSATGIARWDGMNWSVPLPAAAGYWATTLLSADVGEGPSLYVGGYGRWSGSQWTMLEGGLGAAFNYGGTPTALDMTPFNGPEGPGVVVVGYFSYVGATTTPIASSRIAMWVGCPAPCYPDCNTDGQLTVADIGCFQTKFVTQDPYADCNQDAALNVQDFGCFQTKFVQGCP